MMEYGCIGEKLGHSFSKIIHEALFPYKYDLCELSFDEVAPFMEEKAFRAINVTIPYKETVIPFLDYIDPKAQKIGAVNTVVNRDGKLYGYNTDFFGMRELFRKNGISLSGRKVLVLGTGGTSKTAREVARDGGASEIITVSRRKSAGTVTYDEAVSLHNDAEIIINTTPVGMFPKIGESAIALTPFSSLCGVVDAVYNPLRSALVTEAKKRGIPAVGGLYMLISQAVFAAEQFINATVDEREVEKLFHSLTKDKENIVLTGMPGCGKSTVGREIARALSMDFVDTDDEIVKDAGMSIPEIFAREGEKAFRDRETAAIKRVSALQHTVIATGGGAVLREENVDLLKENGRIYFIDRPFEFLVTSSDRPLSSDRKMLKKRLDERYDIYCARCDKRIAASQELKLNVEMIIKDFRDEDFSN